MSGVVYLVGAGPGAPDLLTLRAAKLLAKADIVFHDALVHPDTVALATRAEKVPVGKRCGKHSTAQKFINKRLVDAAQTHAIVVRLKGGDPMLFGRAQEEIAALEAAGVRYEVVPGVTAALAAAAELGISLTQRGVARSVAFVTPRIAEGEPPSDWAQSMAAADAGAIYMGSGQAEQIAAALIAAGKPPTTPIAIVESASLAESHRIFATLASLPRFASQFSGPAVILLGPQFRARAQSVRNSAVEEDSVPAPRRRALNSTD
ncbi:MAG: uroporphyrinogen-III C-methyltransferase [Betaproteobacteria bacterium]|nr:MAG: uroporphyrinogen-III C-methyltransferase [Betaproteobacteria bacterium]